MASLLAACGDDGGDDGGAETDAAVAIDASPVDAPDPIDAAPDANQIDAMVDDRPSSARLSVRALDTTEAGNGFWEYLPPRYGAEPAPLMVFWHGIGENGDGSEAALDKVLANGPPRYIERDEWSNERPFVVLSPQHAGGGCPSADEIRDFLAFAVDTYEVDESRIYLTGLSCGAIGSWNYLRAHLDTTPIAAAVLIAGNGRPAFNDHGCDLAQVPIWGFHGDADPTVAPAGTIEPMNGLIACAQPRADQQLTVYEGVGHDSWSRTYSLSAGHDIYAWLLSQSR
ncbi:hypothetical protein [Haliangium ochraceum]|nr:hypothetical protein [Haliangium ochraceum]